MVYKVEDSRLRRQESMKKKHEVKDQKPEVARLQCNKGKACKFKRSCFGEEDDAASSAMLLIASPILHTRCSRVSHLPPTLLTEPRSFKSSLTR
ncbi:hypothetical protein COCNU_scaffold000154G000240 [Cocos nucifera]|nr:hypothetical protein [Cocos nucifera]